MKSYLHRYIDKIDNLPDKLNKEDILNNDFFLEYENKLKVYYAPHNEYVNKKAKILIVGICPGWTQTVIAFKSVKSDLKNNLDIESILKNCKVTARFAGSMRNNLINMLEELSLSEYLKIELISDLFNSDCELLHTTSLIPYPVFINGKNYTGHTPEIVDSPLLMKYVREHFYQELEQLENKPLIIPLGNAVEDVLKVMIGENIICEEQCLFGFPHPSGANGHRKNQFINNKSRLKEIINNYFKDYAI